MVSEWLQNIYKDNKPTAFDSFKQGIECKIRLTRQYQPNRQPIGEYESDHYFVVMIFVCKNEAKWYFLPTDLGIPKHDRSIPTQSPPANHVTNRARRLLQSELGETAISACSTAGPITLPRHTEPEAGVNAHEILILTRTL